MDARTRADTRLRISQIAVQMFVRDGVQSTTVAQIAAAAGISERTFWRLFAAKEDCIQPLGAAGLASLGAVLASWPSDIRLADHALALSRAHPPEHAGPREPGTPSMTDLVRLVRDQPALQAAWVGLHVAAEDIFATGLARRFGEPADSMRMRVYAAILNGAIRAAVEAIADARGDELDDQDVTDAFRACLHQLPF